MKRDTPQGVGKTPYPLPLWPPVTGLVPFLPGQLVSGLAEPFHSFQFLPHGLHVDAVHLFLGGQQVDIPLLIVMNLIFGLYGMIWTQLVVEIIMLPVSLGCTSTLSKG